MKINGGLPPLEGWQSDGDATKEREGERVERKRGVAHYRHQWTGLLT